MRGWVLFLCGSLTAIILGGVYVHVSTEKQDRESIATIESKTVNQDIEKLWQAIEHLRGEIEGPREKSEPAPEVIREVAGELPANLFATPGVSPTGHTTTVERYHESIQADFDASDPHPGLDIVNADLISQAADRVRGVSITDHSCRGNICQIDWSLSKHAGDTAEVDFYAQLFSQTSAAEIITGGDGRIHVVVVE